MKTEDVAEQIRSRIEDLLPRLEGEDEGSEGLDRATVDGCLMGTLTIDEALYGSNSAQAKALFEVKKAYTRTQYSSSYEIGSLAQSIRGTLLNIREELDRGLIRSIATEAAGEVIGDLVALAKAELRAGYSNVAAVLAAAALEDAVKRKAVELGINVTNKSLDSVINALKSRSLFKGAQVPIVSSYVKLRNSAMHAEWDKISDADIGSLIGFLEPFLREHFA
jgi:hypothetical protein